VHLTVTLFESFQGQQIAAMAAKQRLWLLALFPCSLGTMALQGFVLGFKSTPADQMPQAARQLRSVVGQLWTSSFVAGIAGANIEPEL
jgi:hypothetical protein